jgi:hypothetical protein
MRRPTLDTVVNLATLATCAAIVFVLVTRVRHVPPPAPAPPALPFFLKGETLPSFDGLQLQESDRTLLLVLRHDCRFCTESLDFYRRLSATVRGTQPHPRLVLLTTDDSDTARQYGADNRLELDAIVSIPAARQRDLKVPGTPTLILVNRAGVIQEMWLGKLDPTRESQVVSAVSVVPAGS